MSQPRALALGELSWTELAAWRDQIELVLIPLGSTEQHGPNLGLGMDHLAAEAFCQRASARLHPRLLVAPAIPFGISGHHMKFPGTVTIRPETFLAVLEDLIASLRHHGFRRFLFVNGHGGNEGLIAAAVRDFGFRLDIDFIAGLGFYNLGDAKLRDSFKGAAMTGHACEIETSLALALRPDVARRESLAAGRLDPEFVAWREGLVQNSLDWPVTIDALTRNGALGDARTASPEAGEAMVESALADFAAIVDDLRTSVARWNGPPHRELHSLRAPRAQ
ncbi:MAG: creatininase family protein [Actinobacteria bacterium]|nr:creatininase family protein [Actinomycetota bacterium]